MVFQRFIHPSMNADDLQDQSEQRHALLDQWKKGAETSLKWETLTIEKKKDRLYHPHAFSFEKTGVSRWSLY